MWRNYWTVALRALAKNRTYSIINIAGLAIGMAACIVILLYVRYETSYDRWLPGAPSTYQLQTWKPTPGNSEPFFSQYAPYVTAGRVEKDFPQVEATAYLQPTAPALIKDGQASTPEDYNLTNTDFLKVVQLPLAMGTSVTAPDTALLSMKEASRLFGTPSAALGRTITIVSRGKQVDIRIVGILRDIPKNSHLAINAIIRRDYPSFYADDPQSLTCWGCNSGAVYVKLRPGADVAQMEAQMPAWEKRNIPDEPNGGVRFNHGDEKDWHFVNVRDIHLGRAQSGAMTPGNDRRTVMTFAITALLILGMAIVNFTNLATARASQRAREVALRKVLGASRRQLILQFVSEALLISGVAMLIALTLVELGIRPFAAFLDADLTLNYLGRDGVLLPAILLAMIVGVVSGIYPAFFISRFQPAQVLKANRSASETPGSGRLRAALVVVQFAVSIGLMICTAVIYGQTVYARSVDPGFKRDHLLQVSNIGRIQLLSKSEAIADQMRRIPGVVAVGRSGIGISTGNTTATGLVPAGESKQVDIGQYEVDEGFKDAVGLTLLSGRWFDRNRPMDDMTLPYPADEAFERQLAARGVNVVMNELAVKKLGFKSARDATGKTLRSELFSPGTGETTINIIGVVADTRFRSVRTPIEPLMFQNVNQGPGWMLIRYRGDPNQVRSAVERKWKEMASDVPFDAKFSEDIVERLYRVDEARAKIFAGFSLLAIAIGCLGLFGLAAFTAERRTKEIGIRKVLGAGTGDIVKLLVWQFSRPVIIANVIAWPIAWWLMRDWLNGFDQRLSLTPLPFVVAACIALGIAVVTVAGHAVKVARANPIHALRYE